MGLMGVETETLLPTPTVQPAVNPKNPWSPPHQEGWGGHYPDYYAFDHCPQIPVVIPDISQVTSAVQLVVYMEKQQGL